MQLRLDPSIGTMSWYLAAGRQHLEKLRCTFASRTREASDGLERSYGSKVKLQAQKFVSFTITFYTMDKEVISETILKDVSNYPIFLIRCQKLRVKLPPEIFSLL